MSLSNEQIVEAVAEKSLMEVMELVKAIEEKFGVSAAAPVAAAAAAGPAAVVEEQTEFNIILKSAGCKTVWTHKERTFREHGIKCQLNAELSINGFDLHLNIYKKNNLVFSKIIHSGSSSIFTYPYFLGDVKLSADSIMVCDKLGKLIFDLPLSSI